ncbi:hypothetical protein F4777DRAFT_595280 [Nemania sp. FL0916]|nr:hypothetical protein F4777DRAFT_595280 [Nemania sp. FL0916]
MSEPSGRERQPMSFGIASPDDIEDMARFMAENSFKIKWESGVIIPPDLNALRIIMEILFQRYKSCLSVLMDCCVEGSMTGVVLKFRRGAEIRGVMAMNITSTNPTDPWSRLERFYLNHDPYNRWVFPSRDYLGILQSVSDAAPRLYKNILNVPYIFFPINGGGERDSVVTIISILLNTIVGRFGRPAVAMYHCGPDYSTIEPIVDRYLDSEGEPEMLYDIIYGRPCWPPYAVHHLALRPGPWNLPRYLDEVILRSIEDSLAYWRREVRHRTIETGESRG